LTLAGQQRATSLNLYVLEGSVHKAGHRVRITAQLVDALSGAHLWADRFDGSLEDIFKLQDKGGGERRICR
jgi:TolB-like protein